MTWLKWGSAGQIASVPCMLDACVRAGEGDCDNSIVIEEIERRRRET